MTKEPLSEAMEQLVVKYTKTIHPQDPGSQTSELEIALRNMLIECIEEVKTS